MDISKLAARLESAAKRRRTIYYSELVVEFGLPPLDGAWTSHPLSAMFDRLDREDAEANRPFRTSVVIAKELNRPGDGFFKSLFELKHVSAKSENQKMEVFAREFQAASQYPWGTT
jgi:hypothetical protein